MKLQFKEQDFQVQAVKAVVDCFEGQPLKTNRFTLERSKELIKKAKQAAAGVQTIEFEIEEEIGYRNSAIQILEPQLLKNIQEVQKHNDLHESQQIERPKGVKLGYNLTIEMETGTGKTYVYIRSILTLYETYGFKKYLIVVPSVAIRKGVEKTLEQLQGHLKALHNVDIAKHSFVYDSANVGRMKAFVIHFYGRDIVDVNFLP